MKASTVLSFKGDCEAAFKFYEQHLGGQPGPIFRYAGSPMADSVPEEWGDKIMHGSIVVGDHLLMGSDVLMRAVRGSPKASRCHCRLATRLKPSGSTTRSSRTGRS